MKQAARRERAWPQNDPRLGADTHHPAVDVSEFKDGSLKLCCSKCRSPGTRGYLTAAGSLRPQQGDVPVRDPFLGRGRFNGMWGPYTTFAPQGPA